MRTFSLLALGIVSVHGCVDTPGWRNQWNCRSEGWQSVHGCEPGGWTCAGYVSTGMCAGGQAGVGKQWTLGAAFNYPENNCCACGKVSDTGGDVCSVSSWGAWGTCSATCGGGTQSRTGTGTSTTPGTCVDTPGWRNNHFMCRSEGFQGWQGCEPGGWTCYGYQHEGMCRGGSVAPGMEPTIGWVFNNPELNCCVCGKQAAPSSCQETETRECNLDSCDVDCQGHWESCNIDCEEVFVVDTPAVGGGAACEASEGAKRSCNGGEGLCPLPCEVTPWSSWGDCSSSCSAGTQSRTRAQKPQVWPSFVGTCTHWSAGWANLGQYAVTSEGECMSDCDNDPLCKGASITGKFGGGAYCSLTSNMPVEGSDNDNYTCYVKPPNDDCAYELDEDRACTGNDSGCPRECEGEWSSCGADCQQTYNWTVQPVGGGFPCDTEDGAQRSCEGDDCPADACAVHNGSKSACNGAGGCRWNKMTKLCTTAPPRVRCEGGWSSCSAACVKTYKITTPASGGGRKCDKEDGDTKPCDGDDCPVTCASMNGNKRGCSGLGCKWNKMTKLCTDKPAPTGCAVHDQQKDACKAVVGCKFKKGKCKGTPREPVCTDFHRKKEQCEARSECFYKRNKCKKKKN